MSLLQTLLGRLTLKKQASDANGIDHYDRLEQLRKNHDFIDVKVTSSGDSYQSIILAIDVDNGELVIDQPFPPNGLENMQAGDTVEITSQSRLALISFYTRILAIDETDGDNIYRLELPEEVGRNHSRNAYRVYVDREEDLQIQMDIDLQDPVGDIRIINLSSDGIKLGFPEDITEQLQAQPDFPHCVIQLPSGLDIDCSIGIKNIYRIRSPRSHSLAGGALEILDPQHRSKLDQYLFSVQRQQRRREIRFN